MSEKGRKSVKKQIEAERRRETILGAVIIFGILIIATIAVGWYLLQPKQKVLPANVHITDWKRILDLSVLPQSNELIVATESGLVRVVLDGDWTRIGQDRTLYGAFAIHPENGSIMYSTGHPPEGGNLGVRKSVDGGITWDIIATALSPPIDFHAMDISPVEPNVLYGFDSEARGLFKSVDGGYTWQQIEAPQQVVTSLSAHPSNVSIVLAGTSAGLFISEDGGQSWKHSLSGVKVINCAYSRTAIEIIYASTMEQGLIRSIDGGKTWRQIGSGLGEKEIVYHIATDHINKDILYVATLLEPERSTSSIYKSIDEGLTWSLIATNGQEHPLLAG